MVSKNVMRCQEFDDAVFYKIGCYCMHDDCNIVLEIENKNEDIIISMCQTLSFKTENDSKLKSIWNRLKGALKILVKGELEMEGALYMYDKDHIKSFINALEEGITRLERSKDESR